MGELARPDDTIGDDDWEGLSFEEFVEHQRAALSVASADDVPAWILAGSTVGGQDYARLIDALRTTRDAIADAHLDHAESTYLLGRLEELSAYLCARRAERGRRVWANRFDLAARGSAFPPAMDGLRVDPVAGRVRTSVTFGTSYAGAGEAAHGGAVSLLFDEVLGLASNAGRPPSRTAYLHVDYRAVTPLNEPLQVRARITRIEGRKRWVTGELVQAVGEPREHVVAEAEGLFVELRAHHA